MAILAGSVLLKLPQIINIYSSRDIEGLSPMSFYSEVVRKSISTTSLKIIFNAAIIFQTSECSLSSRPT
jgi:uncharacterized protein with PQ loop repeat